MDLFDKTLIDNSILLLNQFNLYKYDIIIIIIIVHYPTPFPIDDQETVQCEFGLEHRACFSS